MIAGIIPSPSTWGSADNADMAKSRFARAEHHAGDGAITAKQHTDAKFADRRGGSRTIRAGRTVICWIWCAASWQSKAFTKED